MNTAIMTDEEFSAAAADAITTLTLPKDPDPTGISQIVEAAQFAWRFGSLGQVYPGDPDYLSSLQFAAGLDTAIGKLGHWSVQRGEPGDIPDEFDEHKQNCATCNFLEYVLDMVEILSSEAACEACGGDHTVHDITMGADGRPETVCLASVFERRQPDVYVEKGPRNDWQTSDTTCTARWTVALTDGTYGLVTRAFYTAVDVDARAYVECENEYLICHDPAMPGDTEVASDVVYVTEVADPDSADLSELAAQAGAPDEEEWQQHAPEFARALLPERQPVVVPA